MNSASADTQPPHHICICLCVCIRICECIYAQYTHMYKQTNHQTNTEKQIHKPTYAHTHICIYIYTHTYTYHIHIHIFTVPELLLQLRFRPSLCLRARGRAAEARELLCDGEALRGVGLRGEVLEIRNKPRSTRENCGVLGFAWLPTPLNYPPLNLLSFGSDLKSVKGIHGNNSLT